MIPSQPAFWCEIPADDGGYFEPPMNFTKETEAAGAYGENVRDPAELGGASGLGAVLVRAFIDTGV